MFPGTVAIVNDKVTNTLLHPEYRRYENDNKEFNYFVTRLLARVSPHRTNFRTRKHVDLISDIFTVTDEAFVLFVLHNEYDVWEEQKKKMGEGKKGKELVMKKRFCNSISGKKDSWCQSGMDLFCKLVGEVKYRRDESKELEKRMRDKSARGDDDETPAPAPDLNNREGCIKEYAVNQNDEEMISNLMSI